MKSEKTIAEIKKDLLIDDLVGTDANSEEGKDVCVKKLQKISQKLLQEYEIRIGDFIIEPLWIEAYYYNEYKGFKDDNMHAAYESKANTYELARERQQDHFGELYVHYGANDGIDIVLSDGNYYFSFLIKCSLINGEFSRQRKTTEILCDNCSQRSACDKGKKCQYYDKLILKKRENKRNSIVFYTVRKGLVEDNFFKDKKLAAVTGFDLKDKDNKCYKFDFETGYGKTKAVAQYMFENDIEPTDDEIRIILGSTSKEVKEYIQELKNGKEI